MVAPAKTLIYRPASIIERLDLAKLFAAPRPVELEIGSGDGSFLTEYARRHPELNLIGIERLLGRLRKIDKKGLRSGLDNLLLLRLEASYVLEYLLPLQSLQAIHIYFPDPWPKRRHRKNRLVNERFPISAAHALNSAGQIHLRTDDADYFAQMQSVFAANPGFEPIPTPAALLEIVTDFERDFHARGIPTLHATYRKRA
jgi:tRNA (guanine-N7-)-methyltransferase